MTRFEGTVLEPFDLPGSVRVGLSVGVRAL